MPEEAEPDPLGIGSSHYHNVPLAQRMDASAGHAGAARSSATAAVPAPPPLSMAFQPGYGYYYGYGYYGGHGWPMSPGPESVPIPDAAGSVRGRSSTYHVIGMTEAARPGVSRPSARDLFYTQEEEAQQNQPDEDPPLNDDEAVRRRGLYQSLYMDVALTCSTPCPCLRHMAHVSAKRRNGSRR